MKIVYVDEAGISRDDTHLVLTGVIVENDEAWLRTDQLLRNLSERFFYGTSVEGATHLHAKDIFHGTKAFSRDRFSFESRIKLLTNVLSVPRACGLTVAAIWVNWREFAATRPDRRVAHAYFTAYQLFLAGLEDYFRNYYPDEKALVLWEDNNQIRTKLRGLHAAVVRGSIHQDAFPLNHIVDHLAFAEKGEARILEAADAACFAIARHLALRSRSKDLIKDLFPDNNVDFKRDATHSGLVKDYRLWLVPGEGAT